MLYLLNHGGEKTARSWGEKRKSMSEKALAEAEIEVIS